MLLSFAIPTYNFGKFIADTIKSITDGAEILNPSEFEIVILDGGSLDETEAVVLGLMEVYENIRYIKQPNRGGIDRDINSVVDASLGKYIWLFSADDYLIPGWDRYINPLLNTGSSILLVPAILCDFNMRPLRPNPIFLNCETSNDPITFIIGQTEHSLDEYLSRISTLEAMFSFMSAVIVDQKVWQTNPIREDYFGTCWAHCARLMPVFSKQTKITYVNHYLIVKRSGNDSFMEQGFVNRIAIAVDGWTRIIDEFFSSEIHRKFLRKALRKDMPILLFIYAKISATKKSDLLRLNAMLNQLYEDVEMTFRIKLCYNIFKLMPASPLLNKALKPFLPFLIKFRHRLRAAFS